MRFRFQWYRRILQMHDKKYAISKEALFKEKTSILYRENNFFMLGIAINFISYASIARGKSDFFQEQTLFFIVNTA